MPAVAQSYLRHTNHCAAAIDKKACLCCQHHVGQAQSWILNDADHSRLIASCLIYQEEDRKAGLHADLSCTYLVRHEPASIQISIMLQVMPFLAPFVGPGRLFNFLIRNRWCNDEAIAKLGQLPVCLLSSLQVCCLRNPNLHAAFSSRLLRTVLQVMLAGIHAARYLVCRSTVWDQHIFISNPQFVDEQPTRVKVLLIATLAWSIASS